jgi:hypothetical protein
LSIICRLEIVQPTPESSVTGCDEAEARRVSDAIGEEGDPIEWQGFPRVTYQMLDLEMSDDGVRPEGLSEIVH